MVTKTYGYDRKVKVPALAGTHAKLCPKCDAWFACPPRRRVCDRCSPLSRQRGSEGVSGVVSGVAHNPSGTLPITRQTRRSQRGQTGVAVCRELACDAARHADYGDKPWVKCTGWCEGSCSCSCHADDAMKLQLVASEDLTNWAKRVTAHNVALGLQGKCDLKG